MSVHVCCLLSPTVTALLAMAEFFLCQRPLPASEAARCLLGLLALRPVPRLEASVRLRLGLLLCEHTCCVAEAREHLEKAVSYPASEERTGGMEGMADIPAVFSTRCWLPGQQPTCSGFGSMRPAV